MSEPEEHKPENQLSRAKGGSQIEDATTEPVWFYTRPLHTFYDSLDWIIIIIIWFLEIRMQISMNLACSWGLLSLTGLPGLGLMQGYLPGLTASWYGERSVDIMENTDLFIKVEEGQWVWGRGQVQGENCKEKSKGSTTWEKNNFKNVELTF